jgi:hypothetical protein
VLFCNADTFHPQKELFPHDNEEKRLEWADWESKKGEKPIQIIRSGREVSSRQTFTICLAIPGTKIMAIEPPV